MGVGISTQEKVVWYIYVPKNLTKLHKTQNVNKCKDEFKFGSNSGIMPYRIG